MSTRPTVLYTKKGYGMIIFVPIKKEEMVLHFGKWKIRRTKLQFGVA
jgi:hypothetical protein